ncbi:hypothetical protein ACOME3_007812 [Neoechinorhynchus agilis]
MSFDIDSSSGTHELTERMNQSKFLKENDNVTANEDTRYHQQLDELLVELHEGDITEKGYLKKRLKLLQEYQERFGKPLFHDYQRNQEDFDEVAVPRTFKRRKRTFERLAVDETEMDSLTYPKVTDQLVNLVHTLSKTKKVINDVAATQKSTSSLSRDEDTPRPLGPLCPPIFGAATANEVTAIIEQSSMRSLKSPSRVYSCNLLGALVLHGKSNRRSQTSVITVLSPSGKAVECLTFARLLNRSRKIAYSLVQQNHTSALLAYRRSEIVHFASAFYGCMMASVTPVLIQGCLELILSNKLQTQFSNDRHVRLCLLTYDSHKLAQSSECCLKKLNLMISEKLDRPSKHWSPPTIHSNSFAYIEVSYRFLSLNCNVRLILVFIEGLQ